MSVDHSRTPEPGSPLTKREEEYYLDQFVTAREELEPELKPEPKPEVFKTYPDWMPKPISEPVNAQELPLRENTISQQNRFTKIRTSIVHFFNPNPNPTRRKFLTNSLTLAAAVVLPDFSKLGQNVFTSVNSKESLNVAPTYIAVSPENPVLNMMADSTMDRPLQKARLIRYIETIYTRKNSRGEEEPRPLNLEDKKKGLHPLGPYGDKILHFSKIYSAKIGLPADIIAAYLASKAFHESLWNGTNNQTNFAIKNRIQAGYGLFQLMDDRAIGLKPNGRNSYNDIDTVEKQIKYMCDDFLIAAEKTRAAGGKFDLNALNFYFIGTPPPDKEHNPNYRENMKVIADVPIYLRNMALFDPTGRDLVKLFEDWNSNPFFVPLKNVTHSPIDLTLTFGSLAADTASVHVPLENGKMKEQKITKKVTTLAEYFKYKFGGSRSLESIPVDLLQGHSNETIYMALLYLGCQNLLSYEIIQSHKFNPIELSVDRQRMTYVLKHFFRLDAKAELPTTNLSS